MGRREGESLAARSARMRGEELIAPPERTPDQVRHVWVTTEHGRHAGLHLEWRKVAAGWQGRVVHPIPDPGPAGGWIVVEEWIDARSLERA